MLDSGSISFEGTNRVEHAVVEGTKERERSSQALWLWPTQSQGRSFPLYFFDMALFQSLDMRLTSDVLQKPYVESKGRKFEKARGRRRSRGFKV